MPAYYFQTDDYDLHQHREFNGGLLMKNQAIANAQSGTEIDGVKVTARKAVLAEPQQENVFDTKQLADFKLGFKLKEKISTIDRKNKKIHVDFRRPQPLDSLLFSTADTMSQTFKTPSLKVRHLSHGEHTLSQKPKSGRRPQYHKCQAKSQVNVFLLSPKMPRVDSGKSKVNSPSNMSLVSPPAQPQVQPLPQPNYNFKTINLKQAFPMYTQGYFDFINDWKKKQHAFEISGVCKQRHERPWLRNKNDQNVGQLSDPQLNQKPRVFQKLFYPEWDNHDPNHDYLTPNLDFSMKASLHLNSNKIDQKQEQLPLNYDDTPDISLLSQNLYEINRASREGDTHKSVQRSII